MKQKIKEKRPGLAKKILFHQDTTPIHRAVRLMTKIHELKFAAATLFTRLGPFGLEPVIKPQKILKLS